MNGLLGLDDIMSMKGLPDVDIDGIDWDDPTSFFKTIGHTVPKILSPDEVRTEAKGRADAIFNSYEQLGKILERHEITLQRRWTKKTRQQRLKILLEAWPGMPTTHRPDFDAFRRETPEQRRAGKTEYRDAFMWPYINQEDLSQTKPLLLLLNARGRNCPSTFASADWEAMHLGTVSEAISAIFLNRYTMVLNGASSVDEYGVLLSWSENQEAFYWSVNQKQFMPGQGLLILEVQERLMAFLVNCCQKILPDIPEDKMTSAEYPVQPEPHLKTESETNGFESLALMAAEAPYRPPARLDLGRVVSLLAAKASAAEDHLWALREDPSYFAQHLLDLRDHRQETMKDHHGKPHQVTLKGRDGIFWARVLRLAVRDACVFVEVYSELREQAKSLRELQRKYEPGLSPLDDLPQEYLDALVKFRHSLYEAAKGPFRQLRYGFVSSPPIRQFYVRDPDPDPNATKISLQPRTGVKLSKTQQNLNWLTRVLWENDRELLFVRLPPIVDELERLVQSEAKDLVTPYIAAIIGDIAIISQCIHQLELYQPWAQSFNNAFMEAKNEYESWFSERTKHWGQIDAALGERNVYEHASKFGEPLAGRFTYPIQKRRTKENVDALRRAEANLDAFWAKVDRLLHTKGGKLEGSFVEQLLSQPRILQRTPEWVEPSETKKAAAEPAVVEKPLSPFYFGLPGNRSSEKTDSRISTKTLKTRVKTRAAANRSSEKEGVAEVAPEASSEDVQPSFQVDQRALKVFRTLFFSPEVTSTPGEVPWNDFLHALASTGFTAEKLYGSVWQFSPTKLDVEASIHFHEPHPRGKLAFTVARRYGRRLHRTYGWTGDMFVLNK
ncbi:hypothetical protein IL306_003164 [Fusarium sp. DS 682]|nr:hypothetical protein IL306_003164 [Fusarium sp. DS 682]